MSIGTLKRLLVLLNVAAVLGLAGTAWGFLQHRSQLRREADPPDFVPPIKAVKGSSSRMDAVTMPLGAYPKAPEPVDTAPTTEKKEEILTALQRLGSIVAAIEAYPPYTEAKPSILFEFRDSKKLKTIGLYEALVTKPSDDPFERKANVQVPHRYMLVGCKRDPKSGWTFFEFDMRCDGSDIQTLAWRREGESQAPLPPWEGSESGIRSYAFPRGYVRVGSGPDRAPPARKEDAEKPFPVEPGEEPESASTDEPDETDEGEPTEESDGTRTGDTASPPAVEPVTPPAPVEGLGAPIFRDEGGDFVPTPEGTRYLKENYTEIVKEAKTRVWRDGSGKPSGVHVVRIKPGSPARQFGIAEDDVILAINNQPVKSKAQAVNVVKRELNRNTRWIEVKILRNGREIVKRYDAEDPETRRRASRELRER